MSQNNEIVLEDMLKLSVRLNGVLIPIRSAASTLARYTLPLVIINNNETYPCSLMGSSIAVKYKDCYFLLCCKHQLQNTLAGRPMHDVGLLDADGHSLCSAGAIRFFNKINDVELHDLVIFDFTKPCKDRPIMQERFFNLRQCPPEVSSDKIVTFIASGFPFEDQKYNISEESRSIRFAKRIELCELASESEQPSDTTSMHVKPLKPLNFDPDGMSGGAVFTILLDGTTPHAHLAGMLVRAGQEDIYLLKIGNILQVLNDCVS